MMPFTFTQLTPYVWQVTHSGPITIEDSRQLRQAFSAFEGKLLIDLHDTPLGDSFQELVRVRALLPKTAFYGEEGWEVFCRQLPGKDFYMHEAQFFTDKEEALIWLLTDSEEDRPVAGYDVA